MSFSNDVKEELASTLPNARHCRTAELAAIVALSGSYSYDNRRLVISGENELTISKADGLIHKLLGFDGQLSFEAPAQRAGKKIYKLSFGKEETQKISNLIKAEIIHFQNVVDNPEQIDDNTTVNIASAIFKQSCCKRAYIRGSFLSAGSVADPEKEYHLELLTGGERTVEVLTSIMSEFGIEAKTMVRKKYHVIYLKDSEQIVDFLNIMEAHVALMQLENVRILKDMRNSVNRRVNCEAANIGKTIAAAGKQIEDITYLRDTIGLDQLTPELQATAELRLQYPDSSLSELGSLHAKPVGRSGVNHRLQRLSEMAEDLRRGKSVQ